MLHVPADWDMNDSNGFTDNVDLERLFTTLRDDELLSLDRSLSKDPSKDDETPLLLPEFVDPSSLSTLDVIPGEHTLALDDLNFRIPHKYSNQYLTGLCLTQKRSTHVP